MPYQLHTSTDEIHKHAELGNLPEIESLLKKQPELLNQPHSVLGVPPIIWAVSTGKSEVVKFLLNQDAVLIYPKMIDKLECSVLGFSLVKSNIEMMTLLIEPTRNYLAEIEAGTKTCDDLQKEILSIDLLLAESLFKKFSTEELIVRVKQQADLINAPAVNLYLLKSLITMAGLYIRLKISQDLQKIFEYTEQFYKNLINSQVIYNNITSENFSSYLSLKFFELGSYYSSEKQASMALRNFQLAKNYCPATACYQLGKIVIWQADCLVSLKYLEEAQQTLREAQAIYKDISGEAEKKDIGVSSAIILSKLSQIYLTQDDFILAINLLKQAALLYVTHHEKNRAVDLLRNLAILYNRTFAPALDVFYKKLLAFYINLDPKDFTLLNEAYKNLAKVIDFTYIVNEEAPFISQVLKKIAVVSEDLPHALKLDLESFVGILEEANSKFVKLLGYDCSISVAIVRKIDYLKSLNQENIGEINFLEQAAAKLEAKLIPHEINTQKITGFFKCAAESNLKKRKESTENNNTLEQVNETSAKRAKADGNSEIVLKKTNLSGVDAMDLDSVTNTNKSCGPTL